MKNGSSSSNDQKEIFVTDFDDKSAIRFREQVLDLSELDPVTPIVIHISSYGGFVDALASMIETIESVPNKIITVCHGHAMSCGAMLFSFGDFRFMGKHSRMMIHEISSGAFGDVHDMCKDAEESKRLNEYWMGKLAENCGFESYDELRNHIKAQDGRNMWLTAEQAVEFGIADFVGIPEVVPEVRFQIFVKQDRQPAERRASRFSTLNEVKKTETKSRKRRRGSK